MLSILSFLCSSDISVIARMPFLERHMPSRMLDLGFDIEDWQRALELVPQVKSVQRVLHQDGSSRKSPVEESIVAAGGGHLCPWELYVYINGSFKKDRVASGFTRNRKFLHTYFREPGCRVSQSDAQDVFDKACDIMIAAMEQAGKGDRLVSRAPFDGMDYGPEYLSFEKGEHITPIENLESGSGWSFGCLLTTQQTGWYPTEFAQRYQLNWLMRTWQSCSESYMQTLKWKQSITTAWCNVSGVSLMSNLRHCVSTKTLHMSTRSSSAPCVREHIIVWFTGQWTPIRLSDAWMIWRLLMCQRYIREDTIIWFGVNERLTICLKYACFGVVIFPLDAWFGNYLRTIDTKPLLGTSQAHLVGAFNWRFDWMNRGCHRRLTRTAKRDNDHSVSSACHMIIRYQDALYSCHRIQLLRHVSHHIYYWPHIWIAW